MNNNMRVKSRALWNRLGKTLGAKLGIGIITIVPFVATAYILYRIFIAIDGFLQPAIRLAVGHTIPGAGFAISLLLIILVGVVAGNVIGKRLLLYVESVIPAMPIVRQLYTSIKQIMESFSAPKGISTMRPVFIDFPSKGMKALGFITSELQSESGRKLYVVFVPTAPTPAGGFMQIVEESDLFRTDMSIEDALKMIVSAGKVVPAQAAATLLAAERPKAKD